jgi:glucose-6-phosphate isomerase
VTSLDADQGYLAVMAYLDRVALAALSDIRADLAQRTGRPVTFGWGPRFLHSTGQYHKGGAANGVFLQITSDPRKDLEVPGRPFTFGQFIVAQAMGDAQVLIAQGRRVLRLHLSDQAADMAALRRALT